MEVPMADHAEYRPPTQSQKPNLLIVNDNYELKRPNLRRVGCVQRLALPGPLPTRQVPRLGLRVGSGPRLVAGVGYEYDRTLRCSSLQETKYWSGDVGNKILGVEGRAYQGQMKRTRVGAHVFGVDAKRGDGGSVR